MTLDLGLKKKKRWAGTGKGRKERRGEARSEVQGQALKLGGRFLDSERLLASQYRWIDVVKAVLVPLKAREQLRLKW